VTCPKRDVSEARRHPASLVTSGDGLARLPRSATCPCDMARPKAESSTPMSYCRPPPSSTHTPPLLSSTPPAPVGACAAFTRDSPPLDAPPALRPSVSKSIFSVGSLSFASGYPRPSTLDPQPNPKPSTLNRTRNPRPYTEPEPLDPKP